MKNLISVIGTTGIGKTRLAIDLAKHYNAEILSCDSRQFFREMKIGTAAPSEAELAEARHHFIGHLSVQDYYSIGQFEIDALEKLSQLFENQNVVILVGGSMMYEKAVIEGLNDLPEANAENQKRLAEIWEKEGYEKLLETLQDIDNEYFTIVDKDNPRRILRAIDVIWQSGKKYSELIAEPKKARDFRTIRIGIEAPREIIYQKINERVDKMMAAGLLAEVKSLAEFQESVPLKTVGYTELFRFLNGEWDLEFAVAEIKKNSRRFAKRQLTWYRGESDIHWVNFENAFAESLSLLEDFGIQKN